MTMTWALPLLAAASTLVPPSAIKVYQVRPSQADPAVRQYDDPSYVMAAPEREADAPLAVFLTGTGGKPSNTGLLLSVMAQLGYRAIGLEYDDTPAVSQVCPQDPDPDCSSRFREMRVTGEGGFRQVSNPKAEAIIPRLVAALRRLDQEHPNEGWGQYLDGDQPRWSRMVVSGLSQGAGMAAWIAKRHEVARVVLFSSPWDVTGPRHEPAPWLSEPSRTPPDRWFAEYHAKEKTADLIAHAYAALQIPADHVRVFDKGLAPGQSGTGPNPYHSSTVFNPAYAPDWMEMFGRPTPVQAADGR